VVLEMDEGRLRELGLGSGLAEKRYCARGRQTGRTTTNAENGSDGGPAGKTEGHTHGEATTARLLLLLLLLRVEVVSVCRGALVHS
jgi:hypothetical protein